MKKKKLFLQNLMDFAATLENLLRYWGANSKDKG